MPKAFSSDVYRGVSKIAFNCLQSLGLHHSYITCGANYYICIFPRPVGDFAKSLPIAPSIGHPIEPAHAWPAHVLFSRAKAKILRGIEVSGAGGRDAPQVSIRS